MIANFISGAQMHTVFIVLIIGFFMLIKGADFFVEGSASLAKKFNVPTIIIGLTIVAMGTSLPETAVSVAASIENNNELAISNAIGSNIFNLMMVIGVCAMISPMVVSIDTIKRDIPFSAACAVLLIVAGVFGIGFSVDMELGRIGGIVFLVIFVFYILSLIKRAKQSGVEDEIDEPREDDNSVIKCLAMILIGGAAIALGGECTVDAASRIAVAAGMSQTLVGLTIVSIGTSLPELVTSIVAARKKEQDLALGNAVGSNVFNILMVVGVASSISPIAFIMENVIDIAVLLVFTLIVWLLAFTKRNITRVEGFIMFLLYAGYFAYIIIR